MIGRPRRNAALKAVRSRSGQSQVGGVAQILQGGQPRRYALHVAAIGGQGRRRRPGRSQVDQPPGYGVAHQRCPVEAAAGRDGGGGAGHRERGYRGGRRGPGWWRGQEPGGRSRWAAAGGSPDSGSMPSRPNRGGFVLVRLSRPTSQGSVIDVLLHSLCVFAAPSGLSAQTMSGNGWRSRRRLGLSSRWRFGIGSRGAPISRGEVGSRMRRRARRRGCGSPGPPRLRAGRRG